MAIVDSFTLVAGLYNPYGTYIGFRSSTQQGSIGTINGANSNYTINPSWIGNQSSIQRLERGTDPGFTGIRLEVAANGTPPNSGWYDLRIGSSTYLRTDASSNSINSGYGRDWKWSTSVNPMANGGTYSVVVTDDGSTAGDYTSIPIGIGSGAISMGTLRDFFGEPTWGSQMISMSDLYKGGNLVPNVTANAAVPTSGVIDMADFYNNQTTLLIDKQPGNKTKFVGFGQGSGTAVLTWNVATDPNAESDIDVGYKALKSVCEYRWVISVAGSTSLALNRVIYNGSTITAPSMPYTTVWSPDPTITLEVDYGVQTDDIAGHAYFEVRKIWNGTTYSITSDSAGWGVIVENAGQ
jgi:hypothetical protein